MKSASVCVVVTGLAASAASADCTMPSLVRAMPDGATATEAELLVAQSEVKAYIAAMDSYVACTNEELTASGDDATKEFLFLMTTRIASARDEIDAIATAFNDQVKAFRAANPDPAAEQVPARAPVPGGLAPGPGQPASAPGNAPPGGPAR